MKDLVRPLSKEQCFRTPFVSQHVKESQTLLKSAWEHFHHIFSLLWQSLTWKMSPLVICSILGAFRNTLTANDKYPCSGLWRLSNPIQMQLSLKPKIFSVFFNYFWNLHQTLNNSNKNIIVTATLLLKLQPVKDLVWPHSEKHCFRTPFDSQDVKGSQTLLKSASVHFHHVFQSLW